jgi:hypothetical protein
MKLSNKYQEEINATIVCDSGRVVIVPGELWIRLLNELDATLPDELAATVPEKPSFDWSQCPRDMVFVNKQGIKYHLLSCDEDGDEPLFLPGGTSSLTRRGHDLPVIYGSIDKFKLAHNPPRPWFGSKQPVPDETRVNLWFRDGGEDGGLAKHFDWGHSVGRDCAEIIAYEILGENDD